MMALPFPGGSATGLSATDACCRAAVGDGDQRNTANECSGGQPPPASRQEVGRVRALVSAQGRLASPFFRVRASEPRHGICRPEAGFCFGGATLRPMNRAQTGEKYLAQTNAVGLARGSVHSVTLRVGRGLKRVAMRTGAVVGR